MAERSKKRSVEGGTPGGDKRYKPDYSDTVTILVGRTKKSFTVHKTALFNSSPFFVAACSDKWIEGQENVVKLPAASAELFATYIHWTYSRKIDGSLLPETAEDKES